MNAAPRFATILCLKKLLVTPETTTILANEGDVTFDLAGWQCRRRVQRKALCRDDDGTEGEDLGWIVEGSMNLVMEGVRVSS